MAQLQPTTNKKPNQAAANKVLDPEEKKNILVLNNQSDDDDDYSDDDNQSYEMNQQVASPQAFAAAKSNVLAKEPSQPGSIAEDDFGNKAGANGNISYEDEGSDFVLEDDYIDI